MTDTSYEAWVLMALVNRNLDDEDTSDALMLAERIYGIDKTNSFYQYLYAKCLFRQADYMGSYGVLISNETIPCLYLFAKSCSELGNMEEDMSERRRYWEVGIESLLRALEQVAHEENSWGDVLSSVTTRQHTPSIASIHLLLGDLYVKIDHMRPASIHYKACLELDPFKLSAFIKLCDIASDCFPLDANVTATLFKPMKDINTTKKSKSFIPSLPDKNAKDITFLNIREERPLQSFDLPRLRNVFHKTTLDELRAVATRGSLRSANSFDATERDDIEKQKDQIIGEVEKDITQMKIREAYKNKHGLHKKPPVIVPQQLKIDLLDKDKEDSDDDELSIQHTSSEKVIPPRFAVSQG
ncbi:hypothetical protein K501DRAFT_104358, partial [Backusella circina FSU 941]